MHPTYLSATELATAPAWLRGLTRWIEDAAAPGDAALQLARFDRLEHLALRNVAGADDALLAAVLAAHPALTSLELSPRYSTPKVSLSPVAGRPLARGVFDSGAVLDASLGAALSGVRALTLVTPGADAAGLAALRAVESLSLTGPTLTATSCEALAALPRLRALQVAPSHADALHALATSASLRSLSVQGRALSLAESTALAAMPSLERVEVTASTLAEVDRLAPFATSTARLMVRVAPVEATCDVLLQRLAAAVPELTALALQPPRPSKLAFYTPVGLQEITSLANLRWLSLRMLRIKGLKPAFAACIGTLPRLAHLSLTETTAWGPTVSEMFVNMRALRTLDLDAPLTDLAMKHFGRLSLETLRLGDTKIGAKGIAALGNAATLRHLALGVAKGGFGDASLTALAGHAKLEHLQFVEGRGPGEDPTTLAPLSRLPALKFLAIHRAGGRDAWFDSLAAAPSLDTVCLTQRWSPGRDPLFTDGLLDAMLRVPTLRHVEALGLSWSPARAAQLAANDRLAVGYGAYNPDDVMIAALDATLDAR